MNNNSTVILKKLLTLFLVVIGLYYAKVFLMPLAIGAVVATLFFPFCKWMEGKGIPKGVSVIICAVSLLLVISSICALLVWQISELANDFELLKQRLINSANRAQQFIFTNMGIDIKRQSQILQNEQPSIANVVQFVAGSLASVITNFFLTLVYFFGLLYYRSHIKQFLLRLFPVSQRAETEQVIVDAANVSQQYLVGLTKMIFCLWIMYGIGFGILGVKNALFFAVLCGLLEIIPFIGNITGTTITLLVAMVQGASTTMLLGIITTYGIIQFIQGWVLEPLIVGKQVKINPLFTIIALIIGELIWGLPGIFLAIPLIAMFKIACDHIEPLKPYGYLIGEIEGAKGELGMAKRLKNLFKIGKK